MIAKKNSRVDLERKRIVLFNIGLLTAGAFTMAAFTYTESTTTKRDKERVASQELIYEVEFEEPEKEIKQQPVRQQQQQQQQQQQTAGNQNALSQNMTVTQNTGQVVQSTIGSDGPPGVELPTGTVHIDLGEVIDLPKIDAEYIGGVIEMKKFIANVQEYPQIDIEMGNQGTVYVSFVVEKDGKISNVKIERGVSDSIDAEAKRIVRKFPKWKPGEDEYGKVRTRVRLPIKFILEG